jgi:hypothetical protein
MARPSRKRRPTPKGEAQRNLEHAKTLFRELQAITDPNQKENFVNCLNDFLKAARTVPEFLPKESGHAPWQKYWAKHEVRQIQKSDERYRHFINLRDISTHDCNLQPDRGDISVEAFGQMTMKGSFEREVRDATTGKVLAHEYVFAPPEVESAILSARVTIKYAFADWPLEDIVTFCGRVLETLEGLVGRAYALFP